MPLLAISLLTILAGTLLLAKFRKEMMGKLFICISWFFIVTGFILFFGFVAIGICRITQHGFPGQPNFQQEMMMKNFHPGMHGGFCCPPGMDKGVPCCPPGMDQRMCPGRPGCIMRDSTMKCCPGHTKCDSVKMPAQKK